MDGAGAVGLEGLQVRAGSVSFVLFKSIAGEEAIPGFHQSIPRDFGDDGGRRDRSAFAVASRHSRLGDPSAGGFVAVHKHMRGRNHKPADGQAHRRQGRLQDIDLINGLMIDDSYSDIQGLTLDQAISFFSLRCCEQLAVAKKRNSIRGRENDGGGNDGTGEGTSAGFIDAGDQAIASDENQVK